MPGGGSREAGEGDAGELPELTVPEAPAPGAATLAGLLGERYRTVARLGAGAFGEVYRAHDGVLGRDVAIKRIRLEAFAEPAQLEEVKQRFLREAQLAARLRHSNIVTTHDIVSSPATSFIVMELVEGRTLQSLLEARGRLPLEEASRLLGQVAAALDHAHASGIVHRDVKPANVMVEPSGHVKVMDFGIAKAEAGGNLTATGLIMGTPNYMSPEQARGGKVDARSDLFSLGCVLYECLTGVKPFQADSVTAILVRILTEDPPPVDFEATRLPRAVGDVLRRAMAKDPAARYASGAEMIAALSAAGGLGPAAPAPPWPRLAAAPPAAGAGAGTTGAPTVLSRAPQRPRSARRLVALASAAALLLAAGGFWLLGGARAARPRTGALVVEEPVGFFGRLLGRQPRLLVTLPVGTPLRLALVTPLSSETAGVGDALSAETTSAVRIEGVEALPTGSQLIGRVTQAASAAAAGGRGEMTLEFDSVTLPEGGRYPLRTRPLGLRAPALTRRRENAIVAGLSEVGAAVGGLLAGRRGASAGGVVGGAAGTVYVTGEKGRDVTLPARASLSVETSEPTTVARPRQP
ncbi:MAG: serine/threonine-protein kinase [Betaproteobacteria bacterium]